MHPGSLIAIEAVERELREMAAASENVASGLRMRNARDAGRSAVFSIRLDPGEVESLERRAAENGLKPTVFARNLIRMGLAPGGSGEVAEAVERLAAALTELRAAVGY
ncbi:MAG TPA: hypothetical protein VJ831_07110 [Jatrophihabitantaceae bacterium]|nr:hypothetical protein [Jatrophihabitantaceae bacterium]